MKKALREISLDDAAGSNYLVAVAALAMLIANIPLNSFYSSYSSLPVLVLLGNSYVDKPLLPWVNYGLMALLFFLICLEVKREFVGWLREPNQLVLPLAAAIAGLVFSALSFADFNYGNHLYMQGWANLPAEANWKQFYGVSLFIGIGFTMNLYIGNRAFEANPEKKMSHVKIGEIPGSLLSTILGAYILHKAPKVKTMEASYV